MKIPVRLQGYQCDTIQVQNKRTSPYSLHSVLSYDSLTHAHKIFSIAISSIYEPKTYEQAAKLQC